MTGDKARRSIELIRRGKAAHKQGRYRAAHDAFAEAILLDPDRPQAYLGAAAAAQAAAAKAEASGMRELVVELQRLAGRHYLALALLLKDRDEAGAYQALTAGLKADAENAQLWAQLAHILREGGQPTRAEAAARRALALVPRLADAHLALSLALGDLGRFSESDTARREALQLAAMDGTMRWQMEAASLLAMHGRPELTGQEIFVAHRDCSLAVAVRASARAPAAAETPDRRLRVGYVSGDFRTHSVGYFFEPLLANHDGAAVETFCYANVARPDATTERLRKSAHHWRDIVALDDEAVRQQINQDGIDILIDLSGYTRGNRLSVFSVRTAPIAATWLGYPGSTGLPTIDYRITDAVADPPGLTEGLHVETLMRLPHTFLCYRPPADTGDALPPPAARKGHVTFGSFNALLKVTPEVVALWAEILAAVPDSRLLLKAQALIDGGLCQRYRDLFRQHGIEDHRIDLRGRMEQVADHLALYGEVDIALDPFPYNGTTTTCEALWMGVPVVSMVGDRHVARVGATLLTRVELVDLLAANAEGYREIALSLARDPARLAALRADLRQRMRRSPLCDERGFAADFEAALRQMWRRHCEAKE